ncbi:MAG: MarR family transcriptional regulator [Nonomuraea sp.]|nr:MarR family transcriptional regulator [Nonomuraea sp.]
MTRPLSYQALAQVLSQAERSVARRLSGLLEAHGSTIEQWRVLTLLADGHGHAMRELADYAFVPPPTLTRIVDRMIADSLVYRRVDPDDRRRVLIFASARGRKQHARLQRDIDTYGAELDGDLDLGALADLLNRLVERTE